MKKLKGINIKLFFFVFLLVGCSQEEPAQETELLPYYSHCDKNLDRLNSHLEEVKPSINFEVLQVTKRPINGDIYNGLVKISYEKDQKKIISPSVNRYLNDCGPNMFIELSANGVSESMIRQEIAHHTKAENYYGRFKVQIEGDRARVYFSKPLYE